MHQWGLTPFGATIGHVNAFRQEGNPDSVTPWGGVPHGWRGWLRWMWRVLVPGRRWRP